MILILFCLVIGIIFGQVIDKRFLKLNETAFSVFSTVFVFLMGASLGLSRSVFAEAQNLITDILIITAMATVGSILLTSILSKLIDYK
jgi:uncharacterized membrane protein YbjE (DUF340 family)